MSSARQKFPDRLREAREAKGLSQAELADRARMQPSAISHFETGRRSPSFDNLRALADALQVTTDHLLGREVSPGIAGPVADRLFRRAGEVTSRDLEFLAEMAENLAKKNRSEGE